MDTEDYTIDETTTDQDSPEQTPNELNPPSQKNSKSSTTGRRRTEVKYIREKPRRAMTFSKRKNGLLKKAFELSELTGCEVLTLIVSESNKIYSYATKRLDPFISDDRSRELIHRCLSNSGPSPVEESSPSSQGQGFSFSFGSVVSQQQGNLQMGQVMSPPVVENLLKK